MRARNIKPGFYKNADLAECSPWARLLFPGLWMLADREGRLIDRPKQIKGELLPYDSQEIEPLLRELAARGFILRYEIDGERFIQISAFNVHQTPHYSEKPSVIKPPPLQEIKPDISPSDSGSAPRKEASSRGGRNPLNPDVLNPDSGFLTPDSRIPKRAEARASRFALDSAPPDWVEFCRKERPDLDPKATFDRFRDYWTAQPGQRGRKLDWTATFRNWVRSEKRSFAQPVNPGEAALRLLEARDA